MEKSITTKDPDVGEKIEEVYSYDLPDYVLDNYEKKILINDDSYMQIIQDNTCIDSLFVLNGKKIRYVEHYPETMYTVTLYEYDFLGNLEKETVYSKLIKQPTE